MNTVTFLSPPQTGKLLEQQLKFKRNWQERSEFPQRLRELEEGKVLNNRYAIFRSHAAMDAGTTPDAVLMQKKAWDAMLAGIASLAPTIKTFKRSDDYATIHVTELVDQVNGTINIQGDKPTDEFTQDLSKRLDTVVPASPFTISVGERIDTLLSSSIVPASTDLPNGDLTYALADVGNAVSIEWVSKTHVIYYITRTEGGPVLGALLSKVTFDLVASL